MDGLALIILIYYIIVSDLMEGTAGKKKYKKKEGNNLDSSSFIESANSESDRPTIVNKNKAKKQSYQNIQVQDLQNAIRSREKIYDFQYSYNEYLRFILIKVLPVKEEQRIRMYKQQNKMKMTGPALQCENVLMKVEAELNQFVAKLIKFRNETDIEEIQFQLDKKYKQKIYNKKYIQRCVQEAEKCFGFKEEGIELLKKLEDNKILIRVLKKYANECIEDIERIVKSQTSRANKSTLVSKKSKNGSSDQDEIIEDVHQISYYEMIRNKNNVKVSAHSTKSVVNHSLSMLSEPTEEDSVSVANLKRERQLNKFKRANKQGQAFADRKNDREKVLRQYTFEGEHFDVAKFRTWLKNPKSNLSEKNVKIVSKKDPYTENQDDDQYFQHVVQLIIEDNNDQQREQKIIEDLQVYLKYRKVIFVKLKNEKYKKELVDTYEKNEQHLRIRFVKGWKSKKWDEKNMWRCILKNNFSESKKNANNEYFQAFYLQGIRSLVIESHDEIKDRIQNQPVGDIQQQMLFKIPGVQNHIRDNAKLKQLVTSHIESIIKDYFEQSCKTKDIKFVLSGISLKLLVKCQKQGMFKSKLQGDIQEKIVKELKITEFKSSCILDKGIYDKIQEHIIVLQKGEKAFTFIYSNKIISEAFEKINKILSDSNVLGQTSKIVKDKMVAKKVQDYLEGLLQEPQFKDIKTTYLNDQLKFKIYGRNSLLQAIQAKLGLFITQIQNNIISYLQILQDKEGQVLKNSPLLSTISQEYAIDISISSMELPCRLILSRQEQSYKKKYLRFIKTKTLNFAPYESFIIFQNLKEVELFSHNYFIKTYKNYMKKHNQPNSELLPYNEHTRGYQIYLKDKQPFQAILKAIMESKNKKNKSIVIILPQASKNDFVKSIVSVLVENKQFYQELITINFVECQDNIDFKKELQFSAHSKGLKKERKKDRQQIKYYVQDGQNKYFYSDNGNKKIATAISRGFSQVILYNEDLNLTHLSHSFETAKLTITHSQSAKVFPLKFVNRSIFFTLKNQEYEVPQKTAAEIHTAITSKSASANISLGVYEINLTQMKQINLFSDYARSLQKEVLVIKANIYEQNIEAYYDIKCAQVSFNFENEQQSIKNLGKAVDDIKKYIEAQYKSVDISVAHLKNISDDDVQNIRYSVAEENTVECTYQKANKKIVIRTLEEANIQRYKQIAEIVLKNIDNKDKIVYPSSWTPQTNQIESFTVDVNTSEFAHVQKLFTIHKIKELTRIQNKIIYRKFYEEGLFLEQLNGSTIKRKQLFHGTRSTNPEDIYRDKEESFNINYSSDNNLLGKGIYFAQKSQYSDSYRHTEIKTKGTIFGLGSQNLYSMFLCDVYVGDSQKCLKHDGAIKDTGYKDDIKKLRFQSMTDYLINSNIFVVYKSRRAYPLYLIKY